jgi:hypothetical protein
MQTYKFRNRKIIVTLHIPDEPEGNTVREEQTHKSINAAKRANRGNMNRCQHSKVKVRA